MGKWIFILVLALFNLLGAEQKSPKSGSLVIVYETGPEGHHLDRIRFWLKDPNHVLKMYPKGDSFVEDLNNKTRTVVIEDLVPGEYSLTFLIPNKDAVYEDPIDETVLIKAGEVVKIDHYFRPLVVEYHEADDLHEWMTWLGFLSPVNHEEVAQIYLFRPHRFRPIGIFGGALNVETNNPDAEWVLLRGNRVIYRGYGSISNLILPIGPGYLIRARQVEGYNVAVFPPGRFGIGRRQSFIARIVYIEMQEPVQEVPVTPPPTPPMPAQEESEVNQPLFLSVESNTDEAIYLLQHDNMKWQGQGKKFSFNQIPPGDYKLNFDSNAPDYLIPPKSMDIHIENYPENIKVAYQITGKLDIETNAKKASVTLISQSQPAPTINEQILEGKKSFRLPPGQYQVIVENNGAVQQQKNEEIVLNGFETKILRINFEEISLRQYEQAHLVIISNIPEAKFKIVKKGEKKSQPVGSYEGKYISLPLEPNASYELVFDPVNNYSSPSSISFKLKPREHRIVRADYIPAQKLAEVSEGIVLLGDVFNEGASDEKPVQKATISRFWIGVYDVTNALYSTWLTKAVKEGKLIYLSDFDKKGQIIDLEGHLICKTLDSDPNSQITATKDSLHGTVFHPIPGKDNLPVINVTWYGAQAYCSENNCRLPTEAEWEKAAAMSLKKDGSLKKYRYGFSQDSIDRTWANYNYNKVPVTVFQVLTTEVGFFNGINLLALTSNEKTQLRTNDAKSPVGAYDMSGNVFQWTADWYGVRKDVKTDVKDPKGPSSGTKKITKGGCYASFAEELRVSKRLPLEPEHCDPYTGFRVAK